VRRQRWRGSRDRHPVGPSARRRCRGAAGGTTFLRREERGLSGVSGFARSAGLDIHRSANDCRNTLRANSCRDSGERRGSSTVRWIAPGLGRRVSANAQTWDVQPHRRRSYLLPFCLRSSSLRTEGSR
jgi:hypothetical protein